MYVIIKTMCPPGYHYNDFFVTVQSCAQVHEFQQNHCGEKRESTMFSRLNIYYTYLSFVRFEHSVCRGSLRIAYIYVHIISIYIYVCIYKKLQQNYFIYLLRGQTTTCRHHY